MKKRFILLFIVALAGCGQRGPLFLPGEAEVTSPESAENDETVAPEDSPTKDTVAKDTEEPS